MATTIQNPTIGQMVYEIGRPRKAGKIISVLPARSVYEKMVKIKWIGGTETETSVFILRDLIALLKETEHKVEYHKETLAMVEAL